MEGRNLWSHLFHLAAAIPAKLVGRERWSRYLSNEQRRYSFDKQRYIGVTCSFVHSTEEKVLKKDYLETVEVSFEGKTYHGPGNYHQYLTQLYGDYMKLPPEEKRVSEHNFKMFWRKK